MIKKILCLLCIGSFLMERAYTQNFTNASLEAWGAIDTCETNTPPDGWLDYSNAGIGTDEVDFSLCPTSVPSDAAEGNIYARMYGGTNSSGEGMCQYISGFTINNTYNISFDYAGTSYTGGTSGQIQMHLFIDDIDITQTPIFNSNDSLWENYNFNFSATQVVHKIGIRLYKVSGSASGAVDNFKLLSDPSSIKNLITDYHYEIYPNPSNGSFTIYLVGEFENEIVDVTINDVTGKLVKSVKVKPNGNKILIENELSNGVYLISVRDKKGYTYKPEKITVIK